MDSVQLITKYNYPVEKHLVVTEDGYVLNIYRIPKRGTPVLLVHGIGDSSDSWMVLGPKGSLAFRLADAGFDVWLFNSRGNKYSKRHVENLSMKQYWNFSFEEMGSKDLPATIDYILSTTSEAKLSYVGFSQGTTIFFVLCSMRPEYNSKIKQAILLAPVAEIKNIKIPLINFYSKNYDLLTFLAAAGVNEVFASNVLLNIYHANVCNSKSPVRWFCQLNLYANFGLNKLGKFSGERLPIITSHIPAGTSSKTFLHFLQGYIFKSFRRFDYGEQINLNIYNSTIPPTYELSKIDAPVFLVTSESDWFSTVDDVKALRKNLRNIVNYLELNKTLDFTHLEFVYGVRAKSVINERVISFLRT
ncbi:unnamed protein product [Parnassius apollo]|uniref:(apollo) hypothetical protein n=1 Tax=Parnassius apollo TaxID=110799 RepID=A0A8S3X1B9_PARAO|nr:unnamed protein product [Parnassius apollo]